MVETITVTTNFVVRAVTTKLVVTAVMMKLVFTAVTTKLVVTAVKRKLVLTAVTSVTKFENAQCSCNFLEVSLYKNRKLFHSSLSWPL